VWVSFVPFRLGIGALSQDEEIEQRKRDKGSNGESDQKCDHPRAPTVKKAAKMKPAKTPHPKIKNHSA
jgi:hypothetical protein